MAVLKYENNTSTRYSSIVTLTRGSTRIYYHYIPTHSSTYSKINTAENIVSLETEIVVLNAKLADATGDREMTLVLLNAITARS
jgi:hypothetical protein